jgi:hypothetical protein
MDASFKIFVGVRSSDCNIEELIAKFPKDMRESVLFERGDIEFEDLENGKLDESKYGFIFDTLDPEEGVSHLAIVVHSGYWGETKKFDLKKIQSKVDSAKSKMQKLFDSCGISDKIDVWSYCGDN